MKPDTLNKGVGLILKDVGTFRYHIIAESKTRPIVIPEPDNVVVPPVPEIQRDFSCHLCSCSFNNKQELSTHLFSKHKVRAETRSFTKGTVCQYCLMDYGTRYRLVNHVAYPAKKSPMLLRCQHYYLNHVGKLYPELVKQLDAEEAQNI